MRKKQIWGAIMTPVTVWHEGKLGVLLPMCRTQTPEKIERCTLAHLFPLLILKHSSNRAHTPPQMDCGAEESTSILFCSVLFCDFCPPAIATDVVVKLNRCHD
jgi:hypothetical protein